MAVAWAIFKNPPNNADAGSFWAVVLLFAIPLLGFGIAAVVWSSRLDRRGRGTDALLSTGVGVMLIAAFALVILWATLLTVSDH
jgi:MFS family permease